MLNLKMLSLEESIMKYEQNTKKFCWHIPEEVPERQKDPNNLTMETEFSSSIVLGDDIFSALNSFESGLSSDKKSNLYMKKDSDLLNNQESSIQTFDFPQMPLLTDDRNTIDEFLNFNVNKKSGDECTIPNQSTEEPFMNLFDEYPRIDFHGMSVDKPIDVVVGMRDEFVVKHTIKTDNNLFTDENKTPSSQFKNSDFSVKFDYLQENEPCFSVLASTNSENHNEDTQFNDSDSVAKFELNISDNMLYNDPKVSPIEMLMTPLEYSKSLDNNVKLEQEDVTGGDESFDDVEFNKKLSHVKDNSTMYYVRQQSCGDRNVKIWQCGVCGKDFRHQYTLTRHLPTHTDERNYKCETCGKAFRQMSTLSQHRAIHSDARPYVCEFCRKTFNRVSTLISHKKTHSDYKPHQCNICGKAFHQKGNLRNHIFTHTNERPYKCDVCGKGFNQMSNLMCHKAHAHSEKGMYACSSCGQVFNKRFSLRTHEEYVHGIKYPSKETRIPNDRKLCETTRDNITNFSNVQFIMKSPLDKLRSVKSFNNDNNERTEKDVSAGVVIELIKTKAMETAKMNGQTPFALLKPCSGIPVLVKVLNVNNNTQHMLVPATAEDLKLAGTITVASNEDTASVKAVQIKVPVVASVIQTFDAFGKMKIQVEPPGPELKSSTGVIESVVKTEPISDVCSVVANPNEGHIIANDTPFYVHKNYMTTSATEDNINMASIISSAIQST